MTFIYCKNKSYLVYKIIIKVLYFINVFSTNNTTYMYQLKQVKIGNLCLLNFFVH